MVRSLRSIVELYGNERGSEMSSFAFVSEYYDIMMGLRRLWGIDMVAKTPITSNDLRDRLDRGGDWQAREDSRSVLASGFYDHYQQRFGRVFVSGISHVWPSDFSVLSWGSRQRVFGMMRP